MFDTKAKFKVQDFLRHIDFLAQNSPERVIDGLKETEKELIKQFTDETEEFIKHNEWGIGLEILLTNIYEIEFNIDQKAIVLAREAIQECGMKYKDWVFIEELVK